VKLVPFIFVLAGGVVGGGMGEGQGLKPGSIVAGNGTTEVVP
jgi:hypothetical protein